MKKAQAFFEGLKSSGAADVFQWCVLLHACDTSAERQRMIEEMPRAGVRPNVAAYNMLVRQLMIEGKTKEARAVVKKKMPAAGLRPDKHTKRALLRGPGRTKRDTAG